MPYPNEHAARLKDPDKYTRIRRQNNRFGQGIHALFGVRSDGKSELQALRFDREKFTVAQARKWLTDHDYPTGGFVAATGESKETAPVTSEEYPSSTTTTAGDTVVYVEQEEKDIGEKMMHPMEENYMDAGPISFSELKAERAAMEAAMEVNHMAGEFPRMVRRIFSRPDVDKDGALETLAKEFIEEARGAMDMESKEYGEEFILPIEGDEVTKELAEILQASDETDLHAKFTGSPRNKYGTHASYGFKGSYAQAWRIHFSKVGGGALTGNAGGPIRGTVRRTEMIAAAMKPPCNLPGTESVGARSGGKSPLSGSYPEKPSDYGLSSWAEPENDEQREGTKLSCDDLATIKRAALAEIKWRQEQREKKEMGLLDRVIGAVKSAFEKDNGDQPSFMLWKEADGTYTWLARYSNNFRDQDNPPEIIASKSHQHFVDLVDRGAEPPPDLWLWHRPEWRWGRGSWAAWDDKGFALAGGKVEKGFEPLAEQIMAVDPDLLRVSHGMPKDSIKRDPDDPSIIVEHVTREISPLPAWAAANQLTGFTILKEVQDMAIPKDKKDTLVGEWGLSGELLEQLEAANAADADKAAEAGIEHKEKDTDGQQAAPDEAQAEPAAAAPQAEEAPISRQELAEALGAVGEAIKLLTGQVKEMAGDLQALKEARTVEEAQSLSDIFKSAVGHPDARVDGRTTEAKDRPRQTKPEPDAVVATANPLVDGIVNSIVSGTWLDDFRQTQ